MTPSVEQAFVERILQRDRHAVGRGISLIETGSPDGISLIKALYGRAGRAFVIGVTGAPGVGKSTVVDRLIALLRGNGHHVGVVAVDPTSPLSGGAILGDRVRMQAHVGDTGVFVRSMATRGQLGGLAIATRDAVVVLDAAGYDIVLIETVGVGQAEVEITRVADISVVITIPGLGDDVQALKAGLMEIGDIFVVNKADHTGAHQAVAEIETMLEMQLDESKTWRPPVLLTQATTRDGIDLLLEAINRFHVETSPLQSQRRRNRDRLGLWQLLQHHFRRQIETGDVLQLGEFDEILESLSRRELDPYTAVETILERTLRKGD
jgi:LAO/AO transport system kinase